MNNAKSAAKTYAIEGWDLGDNPRYINIEQEGQQVYVNDHTPGNLLQNCTFSFKYLILQLLRYADYFVQ